MTKKNTTLDNKVINRHNSSDQRQNEPITYSGLLISPESSLKAFFGTITTNVVAGTADFLISASEDSSSAHKHEFSENTFTSWGVSGNNVKSYAQMVYFIS